MIGKIKQYFKKHPLIKTGANYSIWGSIKSVCTTLVGLSVMRWLTPDELGMWNTVSIFLAYTPFLQLGIQSGLNTELPVLLGRNDEEGAKERIANGYGYAILVSLVILVLGSIFSVVYYLRSGLEVGLGVVTITIVAISSSFSLHFIARYRSAKAFDRLVTVNQIEIPILLFSVYLIYRFHYWGILGYNVLTNLADIFLMYHKLPYKKVKPHIRKPVLFSMGKMGIAMMVLVELKSAAQTLPRWIILTKSNREKLGLYTPATAINSLINLIPRQFAQFFYPQMGFIYGKTGKASDIWPYVRKLQILLPLAVLPVSAVIYILAPWLLETFFPKYIESLWAMRIMCITFLFTAASGLSWVLNTLKAFKYSYLLAICDFIGCFIWPYLMTIVLPNDILTTVTIGLALNAVISYVLSIVVLRHVLFLPNYNVPKE